MNPDARQPVELVIYNNEADEARGVVSKIVDG